MRNTMRGYSIISLLIALSAITIEAFPRQSCDQDGEFPHENDCSKYYICVANMKKVMQCEDDKHFSMKTKTCENPKRAGCMDGLYDDTANSDTLEEVENEEGEAGCEHDTHPPSESIITTEKIVTEQTEIAPEATESIPESTETETVPESSETEPQPTETVPEPTESEPQSTEIVSEPSETVTEPIESEPEQTESIPQSTETVPEQTETVPEPTETIPEPSETVPESTETVPEQTETIPEPSETVPESTETVPESTEEVTEPSKPTESNPTESEIDHSNPTETNSTEAESTEPEIKPTVSPKPTESGETEGCGSEEYVDFECPSESKDTKLYSHPDECEKFIICVWGRLLVMHCKNGTHFNPEINDCDLPVNAKCDPEAENPSDETTTSQPEMETTTIGSEITTVKEGIVNNICQSDVEELLAHPINCAKFISCSGGQPVEMDCPQDLHFNSAKQECDYQWEAGCNPNVTSEEPSEEVTTPSASDVECPSDMNELYLLPHPKDCSKYFSCVWGKPTEMDCPAGLHFNQNLKVCDWPLVAGCKATQTPATSKPVVTTTTEVSTNEPNESDPIVECRKQVDFLHLVPHPTNCGKFFSCVWGKALEMDCPRGLHFNPNLMICDWIPNAGCKLSRYVTKDWQNYKRKYA